ncbi:MAG TPA: biotin/lipoyl-containing protein [Candidatus Limnocylindrales bacterium]|nr:biotin/lipoyl-containing protein [Candidatus Limnocylindrales bacterium]
MSERIHVRAAAASRLHDDLPLDIDPAEIAVEPWGPGRAVVHEDGRDTWALIGDDRPAGPDRPRIVEVVVGGWRFELEIEEARRSELHARARRVRAGDQGTGPLEVRAVIPGRVAAVAVVTGDDVEAGQTLLVIEAMKMQNELRSPRDGSIERVAVGVGETIDLGQLLVVLR